MAETKKYDYGLGRRKSATARARLVKGKGAIVINDKPALEYLSGNKAMMAEVTDPLAVAGKQQDFDVTIKVSGGGLSGQVDAIKVAIDEALARDVPHPNAVRMALERRRQALDAPPPLAVCLPDHVKRRDVPVRPHCLDDYDTLMENADEHA